jgi:hypothetical protein
MSKPSAIKVPASSREAWASPCRTKVASSGLPQAFGLPRSFITSNAGTSMSP